ncbi:uncharacterized protein ATNIH1004_005318 [Aspergillus tanneri]|uniref:ABM domain-containing protein n=1 Tax=Aspergillus tanneri TaxID=1220188 RepID=A0A5M9MAN5_9EURO|nr:uncharacterized protein ATNIH1004_010646 [Aspergillus tanneri]XP_033426004.1 uncharacterized protein ATNIH1004_005318 [Aspergillus tanneri]KAA8643871.1 hypothetical protein ATNIH1004_010646 [Aspergillus tanneri]KAA8646643.1 hypothetical protein ATNIH1004_005318 [Aspergillus tanneri]
MAEVQLIATLRPAAGKEEQLREILCQTVGHVTRVEKGCFTFLLTESRGADNVLEFKVIERQVGQLRDSGAASPPRLAATNVPDLRGAESAGGSGAHRAFDLYFRFCVALDLQRSASVEGLKVLIGR